VASAADRTASGKGQAGLAPANTLSATAVTRDARAALSAVGPTGGEVAGVCGPGAGPCCDPAGNGSPGCDDTDCCTCICGCDPFCCDTAWDNFCAGEGFVGSCGASNPDGPCTEECSECLAPGGCGDGVCDPAEDCVSCPQDCGDCPAVCGPGNGDCCADNGTPGCDCESCCNTVCAADPFCCEASWDGICADEAVDLCGDLCAGGSCDGGPGCGDGVCDPAEDCVSCPADCGPCPPACDGAVLEADPADGTQDARQPWDPGDPNDDPAARQGIGSADEPIVLTLDTAGLSADCFSVCETTPDPVLGANGIASVTEDPAGTYTLVLNHAIAPGGWTNVLVGNASLVAYLALPADANADGLSNANDVLTLIDVLNDVVVPPFGLFSTDIDHSGIANASDILRIIDLLNGAGTLDAWNGVGAPDNVCEPPVCPGEGDCCMSNGTPGCNDAECCSTVCDVDPFCCEGIWDGLCAEEAIDLCGLACNNDCCVANGNPGCDDAACEAAVCADDPFCCDIEWDQNCADQAAVVCDICGIPPACGACDSGGVCDLQVGINGAFVQACEDGQWVSLAFPFPSMGGQSVDTIRMTHNTNTGVGDLYLTGGTCDGPDVTQILASLGPAIVGAPPGAPVDYVFSPVTIPGGAVAWVVAVPETGFAFDVAYNSATTGATGSGYGNLDGGPDPGLWQDLNDFGFGACYCVDVLNTGQAPNTPGCSPPVCGDGICGPAEDCVNCEADCGVCPEVCGPDAGDCCTPNGTPGCDDVACCESVCAIDPFCCDSQWDGICADEALADPNCTCGGGVPNDNCADAIEIFDGDTAYDNFGATTDGSPNPLCDKFGDDDVQSDVWFNYVATCTETLTVSLCGSAYDTKVAIYNGSACPATDILDCNDDTCGLQSQVTASVVQGSTYKIRVGGFNGAQGSGNINITCGGGGGGGSDCCFDNGTPGCDDPACESCVCGIDPFCCDTSWDGICAGEAANECAGSCPCP
ncbi:MAG: hypothetical protein ACE5E6_11580, partial [Phycisphaerae bacterium]